METMSKTGKIEIRKSIDSIIPVFLDILDAQNKQDSRKPRKQRKAEISVTLANRYEEPRSDEKSLERPVPKRVFLYLKLEEIDNLPKNSVTMKLHHTKQTITRVDDRYRENLDIVLDETQKPVYSITINQDSIDDLNCFSDNPLHISLYMNKNDIYGDDIEHEEGQSLGKILFDLAIRDTRGIEKEKEDEGEEEEEEEESIPVAQGCVDLLQFFSTKRNNAFIKTYLYPCLKSDSVDYTTTRVTWHVYSLLPLMKESSFCNLCFISFESIYNLKTEILEDFSDIGVKISFQSKIPNEVELEYKKHPFCHFASFKKEIIADQNINFKWESINIINTSDTNQLGIYTGCKVNVDKLFLKLLGNQGVDFRYNEIDIEEDYALVCNGVHRYILNEEMVKILEETVAFNEQQLLLEIYKKSDPEVILLEGVIDLSIFLFPKINAMRFAVELRPPGGVVETATKVDTARGKNSASTRQSLSTARDRKSKRSSAGLSGRTTERAKVIPPKPTFAIVNICFMSPITASIELLSKDIENPMKTDMLTRCKKLTIPEGNEKKNVQDCYREFDEFIEMLVRRIVDDKIKTIKDGQDLFCSQLGNLANLLTKIMACDFYLRFPTRTNAEFMNLMTIVYKELVKRIYDIVQRSDETIDGTIISNDLSSYEMNTSIINDVLKLMETMKYMHEAGNQTMVDILSAKLNEKYHRIVNLNFYRFIFDLETHNFNSANTYFVRPVEEKLKGCDYFVNCLSVYMFYMDNISNEETRVNAFGKLLETLIALIMRYPAQAESYILLYCLYKKCNYLPGISFARWKYEQLQNTSFKFPTVRPLPALPISRWEIYCNFNLTFNTQMGDYFFETVKVFLRLGAYKFAEIVYAEIAHENPEYQRYFMISTIKILQQEVDPKYVVKTFPADKLLKAVEIKAMNAHVNGNLEFCRGNIDAAMKHYANILAISNMDSFQSVHLGLLRYGFHMMETQQYELAMTAFEKCCWHYNSIVPYFELGRASYKLNRLKDAEKYFALATEYKIHIPTIWGYLALVNLKMGQNFKALEFWKYAKLKPANIIDDEVLRELNKINHDDVFLYVDIPDAEQLKACHIRLQT